jgi:aminoglycoside 6'-N-acetyltransferase
MTSERVELRDFAPGHHREILRIWLGRAHVVRWWGRCDGFLDDLLQRDATTHAMILTDGAPAGYVCWSVPPAAELEEAGLADLPGPLVDIDIMIGEPDLVGKGIGSRALRLLLERLRVQGEFAWAGVGTSLENPVAIASFESSGFRPYRDFVDPVYGPSRYMIVALRG